MIQEGTNLKVADNTGAKTAYMIGIPKRGNKRKAQIGDVITIAIKTADPYGQVKKGEKQKAVVVRTRRQVRRSDGSSIKFDDNSAVLLDNALEPVGTRIFGPVARELRSRGFMKIISLAPEVL